VKRSGQATENRKQARREWGVASAVLLLLTVLTMRNWLSGGLPISHRQEVLTEMSITWMFRQELAEGQILSGWNPTWFSGFPWRRFLAYPLYYVLAAVSLWGGISLERVLVGFYLVVMTGSGLTMFGYLRRLVKDWRAALVGASIYLRIPFHSHVGVETWIHAAFWMLLPLPLWCIEAGRQTEGSARTGALLLTGLTLGLYPIVSSEYAILAAPFAVLYLVFREWERIRNGVFWRRVMLDTVLVGGVSLGVAAFFVLPAMFETPLVGIQAKHAGESTFSNALISDYAVTPRLVWYAIARRWHLATSREGLPGLVNSFWSAAWYPGLVAPVLALVGLLGLRRHMAARAALVGLGLSLLMVTGPTFPMNFFAHLPVFGRLSPFRGLMMATFFASMLAAYGLHYMLALRFHGWAGRLLVAGLVLALIADYAPNADAFKTTDAYFSEDERAAYAWLSAQEHPGRLLDIVTTPQNQYVRTWSLPQASMPRFAGYYDNGAPLHTWQQLAWTDLATTTHLHQVRFAMVRTDDRDVAGSKRRLAEAGYDLVYEAGAVQILENPRNSAYVHLYDVVAVDTTGDFFQSFAALPLLVQRNVAMVAGDTTAGDAWPTRFAADGYVLVDPSDALLGADASRQTVTVQDLEALPAQAPLLAPLWVERSRYDRIYVEVYAPNALLLTVSESWYPHWRVRVDGQPRPVVRANWALLGVALEPGNHRVTFDYVAPWYDHVGYAITLLTLLALLLWVTGYCARKLAIEPVGGARRLREGYRQKA